MKKVLIGLGVVVVLVIGALLIIPSFIDLNAYKSLAAEKVRESTGRELAIDGDISLSLLPNILSPTVTIEKVRFSNIEGGSAPDMLSADAIELRAALIPLLSSQFKIERISLVKPVILLETLADGRVNYDIGPAEAATMAVTEAPAKDLDLRLDDISIENGTFIQRSADGGETRIEGINAQGAAESTKGPFRATGGLEFQGLPITFNVSTGEINPAAPAQISAEVGLAKTDTKIKFSGTAGMIDGETEVSGKLDGGSADLAAALEALAPGKAAGSPIALDKPFQISGDVNYAPAAAEVKNLSVSLGDMTATGDVQFVPGTPSRAELKLAFNRIDLDKLLAAQAASGGEAPAAADSAPFTLPTGINAVADVTVEAIGFRGGVINDARLVAELADGQLNLSQLSGLLPGGSSFSVAGNLAAVDGVPKFTGAVEGKSDNLRGLLEWLQVSLAQVPSDRVRKMSMTSRLTATPASVEIADLDLKLDSSRVTGGAAISLPGGNRAKAAFGVGLAIDQLNLDAYLPPAAEGDVSKKKGGGLPLDALAPLAGFDANVELRVGKLTMNNQQAQGVHIDGTLQGGTLTLRDLSVKEFAGGKGAVSGTVNDLAGKPRFDAKFDVTAKDGAKALEFAGFGKQGKLGALKLAGNVAGGAQDVAYDVTFSLSGIGASGSAKGRATGIGAGIPRIDTDFDLKAKDAGPLFGLAGLSAADGSKLGAVALKGTATSGENDLTYNVALDMAGIGGKGKFDGKILGLSGTPQVNTRLDFSAKKPAPLLALFGLAGPTASKLGEMAIAGTMAGGADNMKLDLDLRGFGGEASVAGTVQAEAAPTRFDLAISANHPEFRQLLSAMVAGYQPAANELGPLSLSAKASGSTQKASLSGLTLQAGPTSLNGQASFDQGGGKPFLSANLRGGYVDLTPFLPPSQEGSSGGERWSREPMDLSALDQFDAEVDFAADTFLASGTRIDNLVAKLSVRDGVLTISQLTGNTYGGSIDLTGQLVGRGTPTFDGRLNASNLSVSEFLGGGLIGGAVSGPISVNTDLRASGASMADMVDSLAGTGNVDGTITVLNQMTTVVGAGLIDLAGSQLSKLTGFKGVSNVTNSINTVFTAFAGSPNALAGNFTIDRGVLNTQDLSFANNRARALARGNADIGAWTLAMLADIYSTQYPDQPFMSVDLGGPLDSPTPSFRGNAIAAPDTGSAPSIFGDQAPADIFDVPLSGLPGMEEVPAVDGDLIPEVPVPDVVESLPLPDLLPGQEAPDVEPSPEEPAVDTGLPEIPGITPEVEPEPLPGEEPTQEATAPEREPITPPREPARKKRARDKAAQEAPAAEEPAEQPAIEPEPVPEPESLPEPEPEPQPEPEPEPQPEPVIDVAPEQPAAEEPATEEPAQPEQTTTKKKKKKKAAEQQAPEAVPEEPVLIQPTPEEAPAEEVAPEPLILETEPVPEEAPPEPVIEPAPEESSEQGLETIIPDLVPDVTQ